MVMPRRDFLHLFQNSNIMYQVSCAQFIIWILVFHVQGALPRTDRSKLQFDSNHSGSHNAHDCFSLCSKEHQGKDSIKSSLLGTLGTLHLIVFTPVVSYPKP